MTRPLRAIAVGAIAALSAVWAFAVNAQTYPERPIRVIVPIAAGSVTDVIMRATASELAPRLGQPFVIENRGGASGIPGAQACAQAAPDSRRASTFRRSAGGDWPPPAECRSRSWTGSIPSS